MNLSFIKEQLVKNINKDVEITVYGMRNKTYKYTGKIYHIYPNFFTILYHNEEKSFNYRDIVTKDVKIKYI